MPPSHADVNNILSGAIMMLSGLQAALGRTGAPGQASQASEVQTQTETETETVEIVVTDPDDDKKIGWKGKHQNNTWNEAFQDIRYRTWYMGRVESGIGADQKAFAKYCIRKERALDSIDAVN
jgi:hypothetical protein